MAQSSTFLSIKRSVFKILSRTGVAVYSRLPIFGHIHAAVAVIKNGDKVLVIQRSDDRGFSFPGGIAYPWETAEKAMRREVFEETGLSIDKARFLFEYLTSAEVLCRLSVFEAEASGDLAESWEGSPQWRAPLEVKSRMLPSQQTAIDRIFG
jgi:8-oxo-dGTP pyrophosphatase MutT (NUDIX family)